MARVRAGIRIRRRVSPWAALKAVSRWFFSLGLLAAVVVGGGRFLARPGGVGALDYTAHIIGVETGAVGILGMDTADLDGDDDIDLVTAGLDGIKVYENNDDGTFTVKLIDDVDGERVQIIDLNEDGSLDFLVSLDNVSSSVKWYQNTGELEFSGTAIGTGSEVNTFAGDIDADGDNDIIVAAEDGGEVTLQRWMNNGSGSFTAATMDTNTGVRAIVVSDIDGNGYPDVVTGGEKGLQRWNSTDGYSWSRSDIDSDNTGQTHLAVADVNGNGKQDIVAAEPGGDTVALYRNVDLSVWERIGLEGNVDAVTVDVRDLDEDGDEDIVVAGQDDNAVYWFDNNGSEEFTKRTIAQDIQSVFGVVVSDIDGDNDFDVLAGDHHQGNVYWYERIRAKPIASAPGTITQSKNGKGIITFATTLSDGDRDTLRARIQYSLDGVAWHKPWLTKVTAAAGSVDLKNSNGYQVGTRNAIDTDDNSEVTLTMEWDTKSAKNTGGPILSDVGTVKLRIIPRDGVGNGDTATSADFRVDNGAPVLSGISLVQALPTEIELGWQAVQDSSSLTLALYYGTNHAAVLEKTSAAWDGSKDSSLGSAKSTGTTVTGLTSDTQYTFKLFATDVFGNAMGVPSLRATTTTEEDKSVVGSPGAQGPIPGVSMEPGLAVTTSPGQAEVPGATSGPGATILPWSPLAIPSLQAEVNQPPAADAGEDQMVNAGALVILNGTGSEDPERGTLGFVWRQISGPKVSLTGDETAAPSFTAMSENEIYIFTLTVRDFKGLTATDRVTIATRALPDEAMAETEEETGGSVTVGLPTLVRLLWRPLDIILMVLTIGFSLISLLDRLWQKLVKKYPEVLNAVRRRRGGPALEGRVVQFKTGEPIVGAQVLIYTKEGKPRNKQWTNIKGVFNWSFVPGEYNIAVKAEGFVFSPAAAVFPVREGDTLYSGGLLTVKRVDKNMQIVIPMKPTGAKTASLRSQWLRLWQVLQQRGHVLFWPALVAGAVVNTFLLLGWPTALFLSMEIVYVALVLIRVLSEVKRSPSYGIVRNAITRVPVDLAVVRLYERGTNRLVMTRATNARGKFFALPRPGVYTVTVTKPGFAPFTKDDLEIKFERGLAIQMKADIMPIVPVLATNG